MKNDPVIDRIIISFFSENFRKSLGGSLKEKPPVT